MYELSKSFIFEAAHTLQRDVGDVKDTTVIESSRRIHGHSYRATVFLQGCPDPVSGMLIELSVLDAELRHAQALLDHRFLDDVAGLGPATLENLCAYLWRYCSPRLKGLVRITVSREMTGDACSYYE